MNVQKITPSTPRTAARPVDPFSFFVARARMLCHFGESRRRKLGVRISSGIEHVHELAGGVLSSKAEEDVFESRVSMRGRGAKVSHCAERAYLSVLNDADAIAHRFSDLERVCRHHDRVAA